MQAGILGLPPLMQRNVLCSTAAASQGRTAWESEIPAGWGGLTNVNLA